MLVGLLVKDLRMVMMSLMTPPIMKLCLLLKFSKPQATASKLYSCYHQEILLD